jgi:hypothetical protein
MRQASLVRSSTLPKKAQRHLRLDGGKTVIKRKVPNVRIMASNMVRSKPKGKKGRNVSGARAIEKASTRLTKQERLLTPEAKIERNLKHASPWFNSIMDPLTGADVKIPDETGIPTGTMQLVYRHPLDTVEVGSSGKYYQGFQIMCPYPNLADGGTASCNCQVVHSVDAITGGITWGTASTADSCFSLPNMDTLNELARGVRIVSASVTIQPEMSGLNDQGEYISFVMPFAQSHTGPDTISYYTNLYESAINPVNTHNASIARWFPYARNQNSYKAFIDTSLENLGQNDGECPLWSFGVIGHGLAGGSASVAQVVINYEYVPQKNSFNIVDASPSVQDTMDHDLTLKFIQEEPKTGTLPPSEVNRAPAAANPEQSSGPTGFGMFAEVLGELVPEVLPAIMSFL